jgi:hypothetical protein
MTEPTPTQSGRRPANQTAPAGGDAVYALGLIGAGVYFWQRADSVGGYVLAVLKALVWPAFLVYGAFRRLNR